MAVLGITMIAMLMMKPMMKGIASVIVKSALSLEEIKNVIEKEPPTVIIPVYLSSEIVTSAMSSESMKGTEY